jgi:hypothetical protein
MEVEAFKLTIEAAKHIQSVYINNVWTTMGSYLVGFGWLLTSVEARSYLEKHQKLLSNIIKVVLCIYVIHALVLIDACINSYKLLDGITVEKLTATTNHIKTIVNLYSIPLYWPVVSLFINGSIVFLLTQKLKQLKVKKET